MRAMANRMRQEDRAEIVGMGLRPRRVLHDLLVDSVLARVALVDGELAAVWGLQSMMAADVGRPWLFTAPPIERVPVAFFREVRREVDGMLATRRRLETRVLASYEKSIRFFRLLGFRVSEPEPCGPLGTLYRTMTIERPMVLRDKAPFVVFSLPRSRSKWLSVFLGAHHDLPIGVATLSDLFAVLARPGAGTVETGIARAAPILREEFPDARFAVVRRPVEEVRESAARIGWRFAPGYLEEEAARLDAISAMPGTVTVEFADLATMCGCRRIHEHCLDAPFDLFRWFNLADENIQIDMAERLAKLDELQEQINGLFREIEARVTVQLEDAETFYRDGQALFAEHRDEAGGFADLPFDPHIDMMRSMAAAGQLIVVTARRCGEMVGYLVYLINPCLESRRVLLGFQNIFFVRKGLRGRIGPRLQSVMRKELRARGVHAAIMRAGVRARGPMQEHLFRRLGAHEMGSLYYLSLDG
jgi:hypothetical protein